MFVPWRSGGGSTEEAKAAVEAALRWHSSRQQNGYCKPSVASTPARQLASIRRVCCRVEEKTNELAAWGGAGGGCSYGLLVLGRVQDDDLDHVDDGRIYNDRSACDDNHRGAVNDNIGG